VRDLAQANDVTSPMAVGLSLYFAIFSRNLGLLAEGHANWQLLRNFLRNFI
jgi:hypothetical protein